MSLPKISIVTPSYNQVAYVEETLLSVLDQGYPNLEYIVVDGGSTDGTVEILEHYRNRLSRLIIEPDNGQTDALIKGFRLATGDIMAWLNSDDRYLPGTLSAVAQLFSSQSDIQFIYGDCDWIDTAGHVIQTRREIPFNRFIWGYGYNYISQPASFWTRELYEEVGGLESSFDLSMDAALFAKFALRSKPRHVPQTLAQFRFYPEQKNQKYRPLQKLEDHRVRAILGLPNQALVRALAYPAARLARVTYRAVYQSVKRQKKAH